MFNNIYVEYIQSEKNRVEISADAHLRIELGQEKKVEWGRLGNLLLLHHLRKKSII